MSTIERTQVSCDEPGCQATIWHDDALPGLWYFRSTLDLCPTHARERVERPAPAAAPTAGTTSQADVQLALSAHEAIWIVTAMERHAHTSGSDELRELIRELHAQIEDYARRQP